MKSMQLPRAETRFPIGHGTQYKNEVTASHGMLRYKFQDGRELEMPDNPDNRTFFFELVKSGCRHAAVCNGRY
ncbi:MAG: hypothetical protein IJ576_05760 [Synergistaceae bacterium]|nr:hypothetical protein [Synergistaceae bacterium]